MKSNNRYLIYSISIQLAMFGVFLARYAKLNFGYFEYPIIILFLKFLPGYLILKLVIKNEIPVTHKILFSVGLSLLCLMIFGTSINFLLPILGLNRPLSFLNMYVFISSILFAITIWLWVGKTHTRKNREPSSISIKRFLNFLKSSTSIYVFYFLVLLVFTALSSYFSQLYITNIFVIFSVIFLLLSPLILIYKVDSKYYPICLFFIGLTLLLYTTLSAKYLSGADIFREYYFTNRVVLDSYWDPSIETNLNAMLSLTILAPIFSKFMEISPTTVFKVIFPILYSLVPVGIFTMAKEHFDKKKALLGSLFFMFFFTFFSTMPSLARQQIAELFLILILLVVFSKYYKNKSNFLLISLLGLGLVFSHYGIYYLTVFVFIFSLLLNRLLSKGIHKNSSVFNFKFILILIIFGYIWYLIVIPSPGETILDIGVRILSSIFGPGEQHDPEASYAMGRGFFGLTIWRQIKAITQYFIQGFLALGVIYIVLKSKKHSLYRSMSLAGLLILIISVLIPAFAGALNMNRIYHYSLIILSPLIAIGAYAFLKGVKKILKIQNLQKINAERTMVILCVLLLSFHLTFNTGLGYELAGDTPINDTIGREKKRTHEDPEIRFQAYSSYRTPMDIRGAVWISNYGRNQTILSDWLNNRETIYGYGMRGPSDTTHVLREGEDILQYDLIYLDYCNINEGKIRVRGDRPYMELESIDNSLSRSSLIYNNGGSNIYKP